MAPAQAQVYVVPRRPGQSVVRYFDHDWQQIDLLAGEELGEEGQRSTAGGVRLLFYESERDSAEIAAARIEAAYLDLCDEFELVPPERFPYVLYSSYQEFLRTNLFPLQEGVLGVTSPAGLEVTLPYFGDHQRFEQISRHELAHQFTIQKVREAGRDARIWGDPLSGFPLWFIEGLAEFHAHDQQLDEETRATLTDLVVNPDPVRGYALPGFFDDSPWSVLATYELGHARVAFLEAVYGTGTTQRLLLESPRLVGGLGKRALSFGGLIQHLTGDEPVVVGARFDAWLKRRLLPGWLAGQLDPGRTLPFVQVDGLVDSLAASPDGRVLLYRSAEERTGRYRLVLVDPRDPRHSKRVARDQVPGSESLHPVDPRSFDIAADRLIYVAERQGRDVLHLLRWQAVERRPRRAERDEAEETGQPPDPRVHIKTSGHRRYTLPDRDLVAIYSPSLSPDATRVAFIGLSLDGRRDIWVLDLDGAGPDSEALERVTDDPYTERELAWGPAGSGDAEQDGSVLIYTSDATPDGSFDLFARDPATWELIGRLDPGEAEPQDPAVLPDGARLFTLVEGQHRDVFEWLGSTATRRTATTTALRDPAVGAASAWWVLLQDSGRWWPAQVPEQARLDVPATAPEAAPTPPPQPPWQLPRADLDDATAYSAWRASNWGVENLFAMIGAGGGVIYGQAFVSATDQLRDHAVILTAALYGSFTLTDASLIYIDQSHRMTWGAGAFSALRYHIDDSFSDDDVRFQAGQRYQGGMVTGRWPLSRFTYLQAEQAAGAVDSFLFSSTAEELADPDSNNAGRDLLTEWEALYGKDRFQAETTVRAGIDTITYHRATGPLAGASALVEGAVGWQPWHGEVFESLRLDAEGYLPLHRPSGANLSLRGAAGTSWGGAFARSWYLYSPYTLRGVSFGDPDHLLGRHFWLGTTELQVPLDWLVRVAFLSTVEGLVGLDMGAAADDPAELWDRRVLDVAVGTNLVLGPLVFRLHFARPLDIGAPLPVTNRPWVTNFSLGWLGY